MALINCPSCGRQMSDAAKKCPHCGHIPQPTQPTAGGRKWLPIVLAILGVIIIGVVVVNSKHSDTRTSIERHPISQRQTTGWDYICRELNKSDGIKPNDLRLLNYQELTEEQLKDDKHFGSFSGISMGFYTVKMPWPYDDENVFINVFFKYGRPKYLHIVEDEHESISRITLMLLQVWDK